MRERWKNVSEVWRLKELLDGFEPAGKAIIGTQMYGNWIRGGFNKWHVGK